MPRPEHGAHLTRALVTVRRTAPEAASRALERNLGRMDRRANKLGPAEHRPGSRGDRPVVLTLWFQHRPSGSPIWRRKTEAPAVSTPPTPGHPLTGEGEHAPPVGSSGPCRRSRCDARRGIRTRVVPWLVIPCRTDLDSEKLLALEARVQLDVAAYRAVRYDG